MGALASQKLLDNYITMYVYHPAELHGSEEMDDELFLFLKMERFLLNSDLPIIILETRLDKMVGAHLV